MTDGTTSCASVRSMIAPCLRAARSWNVPPGKRTVRLYRRQHDAGEVGERAAGRVADRLDDPLTAADDVLHHVVVRVLAVFVGGSHDLDGLVDAQRIGAGCEGELQSGRGSHHAELEERVVGREFELRAGPDIRVEAVRGDAVSALQYGHGSSPQCVVQDLLPLLVVFL